MAAAVRLLDGCARFLAGCGLALSLAVIPVLRASAIVPVAVAAAALIYLHLRRPTQTRSTLCTYKEQKGERIPPK